MDEKAYISRKDQARLTKKKIFDTTMLLIKKRGYGKITIREICQQAQISIGTFYLYFSSKDEILLEIYNKIDQKVHFPMEESICESICQDFSIYLTTMTEMFHKELVCEIYRNCLASGENHFLDQTRPLYQAVLHCLEQAAKTHLLITGQTALLICRKLHIFVQAYIFQWLTNDELGTRFLTDDCIQDLHAYLTLYIK